MDPPDRLLARHPFVRPQFARRLLHALLHPDPETVSRLFEFLAANSATAEELDLIADAVGMPEIDSQRLAAILRDATPVVREQAVQLGVLPCLDALQDPGVRVRLAAARRLGEAREHHGAVDPDDATALALRRHLPLESDAQVRVAIFQALGGPLNGADARRYFDDLRAIQSSGRTQRVREARLAAAASGREEFTGEQFERHFRWLVKVPSARSSIFDSIEDDYYRSEYQTVEAFAEWYFNVRGMWD